MSCQIQKFQSWFCRFFILVVLFPVFGGNSAQAGTELIYQNQSNQQYVITLSGAIVGGTDGFYDLERDVFVMLEHSAKTFSQVSRQQVLQVYDTAKQAMASVEQMSAYLPPEYRQQLELSKPAGFTLGEVIVTQLGPDSVVGYKCERIAVERNARKEGEVCLAQVTALNLPAEDIQGLNLAFGKASGVLNHIAQDSLSNGQLEVFKQRIPLRWTFNDGVTWELAAVKAVPKIGAIPKGYDEVPFDLSSIR